MAKKKVEFDAPKKVRQETEVAFTKRDGTPVDFMRRNRLRFPCTLSSQRKRAANK